jgi:hypothetical protein
MSGKAQRNTEVGVASTDFPGLPLIVTCGVAGSSPGLQTHIRQVYAVTGRHGFTNSTSRKQGRKDADLRDKTSEDGLQDGYLTMLHQLRVS